MRVTSDDTRLLSGGCCAGRWNMGTDRAELGGRCMGRSVVPV